MQSSVMICSLSQKRCNQQCFSGRRVSGDQKRAAFFTARHPAVKNVPPFSPPGTQRSKTERRFHRPAPSGQKRAAFFTARHPAVKNRPPFSPLLAQRSKTDRLFHHFWPSGQKQTSFFTTFGSAVKNRPPFASLSAQQPKTDGRSENLFHATWCDLADRPRLFKKMDCSWRNGHSPPGLFLRPRLFIEENHPCHKTYT